MGDQAKPSNKLQILQTTVKMMKYILLLSLIAFAANAEFSTDKFLEEVMAKLDIAAEKAEAFREFIEAIKCNSIDEDGSGNIEKDELVKYLGENTVILGRPEIVEQVADIYFTLHGMEEE